MLPQYTLTALICSQLFRNVIATNNNTVVSGWVDDPDGRGTFTIASSCVLTLSLCVYTAIHLNVRPYRRTELQSWVETTKWVAFGILAPELVVFVAWRQYVSAMALDRIVRGLQERDRSSELSSNPTFSGIKVVVLPIIICRVQSEFPIGNVRHIVTGYIPLGQSLDSDSFFLRKYGRLCIRPRGRLRCRT